MASTDFANSPLLGLRMAPLHPSNLVPLAKYIDRNIGGITQAFEAPQPPSLGERRPKAPQNWGLKALRAYKKRGRAAGAQVCEIFRQPYQIWGTLPPVSPDLEIEGPKLEATA